jgi:8-amino-3,8-dideoxy-alpha-D-manno-octulosonate transaminase
MPGFEIIDDQEKRAVSAVFDEGGVLFAHGFDSIRSKYHVREFEALCIDYFSSPYCLAVSSGTAAIKCALKALGVGPGDEVITQGFNFIATAEAVVDCGAVPVVCSVDKNLHLDVESCLSKITANTKAIIIVHMLGMPGPARLLRSALSSRSIELPIIEDACEAVGAKVNNKYVGTLTDIGIFSFDHGKNLTCGEGGMVLTSKPKISKYIRSYSDHGHRLDSGIPRGIDRAQMPGFNYRLTEMQAAVGKVQLSKLERLCSLHRERYLILETQLASLYTLRQKAEHSDQPSFDTFMIVGLDHKTVSIIIDVIIAHGFGTKNIPDAMYWHCSYFWSHILGPEPSTESSDVHDLLRSSVAIPILASRSLSDYEALSLAIASVAK